jgi:predicted dehydrogenase
MTESLDRRGFLERTAATAGVVATAAVSARAQEAASNKIVVGVMGLSRGRSLAGSFAKLPGVEVKYCCDVDTKRAGSAAESMEKAGHKKPQAIADYRRILDDKDIDALVCATPNHWHAPASIMACTAGKNAYVEKPCCHNPYEGEVLIKAARRHNRCVQMGNQRRSAKRIIEGIKLVHEGAIGRPYYSRSWYADSRGPIGKGVPAKVPPHIDYELWQGPAPRQPYVSNRLHYTWHWVWHYGNGELGNNGIHSLDICRWALQVDYPVRVTSSGGRYRFDDDQETADTHVVNFEFEGKKQIMWEGMSCNRHGIERSGYGVTVHAEDGTMYLGPGGFVQYDNRDKVVREASADDGQDDHIANFVAAVREGNPMLLNSEIEEGHKSTLLCHLGNISHRTGRALHCDSSDGHINDDKEAMSYWKRDYEPGWEPKV